MIRPDQIDRLRETMKEIGIRLSDFLYELIIKQLLGLGEKANKVELRRAIAAALHYIKQEIKRELAAAKDMIKKVSRSAGETAAKQTAKATEKKEEKPEQKKTEEKKQPEQKKQEEKKPEQKKTEEKKVTEKKQTDYGAECKEIIDKSIEEAVQSLDSIVQNSGFEVDRMSWQLEEAFTRAAEKAFRISMEGNTPWREAMKQATLELAERGIRYVPRSEDRGHKAARERMEQTAAESVAPGKITIEAAVRESLLSTLGTMQDRIEHKMADHLGTDGWEITAHACSAPDHEPIQGRQYSNEEYERLNDSLVRRIGTLNCGHAAFPIMMGQDPQYTEAELERFRKDNEEGKVINGKHYTAYELTQEQRRLEREIRKAHRQFIHAVHTGDQNKADRMETRWHYYKDAYRSFSKAAGLVQQDERLWIPELGKL